MAALKHYYRDFGDTMCGVCGLRDTINPTTDWISPIYIGLNQAPIVVMIENDRTGLVWKNVMANPEITTVLKARRRNRRAIASLIEKTAGD